jgi:hypothetical protein
MTGVAEPVVRKSVLNREEDKWRQKKISAPSNGIDFWKVLYLRVSLSAAPIQRVSYRR